MTGGKTECKVSRHSLTEFFSLVSNKTVNIAETDTQQTFENLFSNRNKFQRIDMDSAVFFRRSNCQ